MNIQSVTNEIIKNKVIISNFGYLSVVQVFNILFPFITYPYLVRVLGVSVYGKVIFAQSLAYYFSIIVRFGFDISATKDISIHRTKNKKLSQVISSVLTIKGILWFLSLIIFYFIILLVPGLKEDKLLYLLSFTLCFNELLTQQYFFQGMEKMKYITYVNLFTRIFFLVLIFVFVHDPTDYLKVPLLNGLGALISGIISISIVLIGFNIRLEFQPMKRLIFYFKESLPLFFSQAIVAIKDQTSTILVGIFLGMGKVAFFDMGIKFMNLLFMPLSTLSSVSYPRNAKEKNMKIMMKFANISFLISFGGVMAMQFLAPFFVKLIGGELMLGAVPVVRILIIAPLILSYSSFLGTNCLCVFGKYKAYMKGMFYTTVFYLALVGVSYYLNITNRVETFAIITLLVYLFELLYRFLIVKKLRLINPTH